MQAWFFAYQIINDDKVAVLQGDGTFGSDNPETHLLVEEKRNYVSIAAGVRPDQVIFTAFNKL